MSEAHETNTLQVPPNEPKRNLIAFWLLGCINNIGYVIMIAGAEEIASGGVGLVYFFQVFPSLIIKLTGPYWFHFFSYKTRLYSCSSLMSLAFIIVSFGQQSLTLQLIGVAACGIGAGLGEASFLALTAFYDSRKTLACWSSGTGFAGVAGYLWVTLLHYVMAVSFRITLLSALLFPILFILTFQYILETPWIELDRSGNVQYKKIQLVGKIEKVQHEHADDEPLTETLGCWERFRIIATLWPYMVPLCVVYFAEYTMQSGAWAAIGFPVTDASARNEFYEYANSLYQAGVFFSRSSGAVFQASHRILMLMPVLQVGLLIFFCFVAMYHFWYNWWLLIPCFITGLLGGAVYVNAFTLLARDVDPHLKEFALSAASMGDSFGILLADIAGVLVQGCLYSYNRIPGAKVNIQC